MENENDLIETDLIVDGAINLHLKETAGWGKFLAIAGFIMVLIAVGAIYAAMWHTKSSSTDGKTGSGTTAGAMIAIIYLAMVVVVFFMSVYIFRFAKKTQAALSVNDQVTLTEAFSHLKIYFRFAGIITAVMLILTVLGFVRMIIEAASRG